MICVDRLVDTRHWKWGESCHLFSDNGDIDDLHEFAEGIGLKREWFQNDPRLPHYDLNRSKRHLALINGARKLEVKKVMELIVSSLF